MFRRIAYRKRYGKLWNELKGYVANVIVGLIAQAVILAYAVGVIAYFAGGLYKGAVIVAAFAAISTVWDYVAGA